MRLLQEHNDSELELIQESVGGKKQLYLHGTFAVAEALNKNGRIYPKKVLAPAVEKFLEEKVQNNSAFGTLDHSPNPQMDLSKVSHRITHLEWDGNALMGKAVILPEGCGKILKAILETGGRIGTSTKGLGETRKMKEGQLVESFKLLSIDAVAEGSSGQLSDAILENAYPGYWDTHSEGYSMLQEMALAEMMERKLSAFQAFLTTMAKRSRTKLLAGTEEEEDTGLNEIPNKHIPNAG